MPSIAALFRPGKISKPLFAQDRAGMAEMLRFLRKGGMLVIAADLYSEEGVPLDLLGKPAPNRPVGRQAGAAT